MQIEQRPTQDMPLYTTNEGERGLYTLCGLPFCALLITCSTKARRLPRAADRDGNAREACRRACSEICRRLPGPARVCAHASKKDQAESRLIGPIAPSGAMVWTPPDRARPSPKHLNSMCQRPGCVRECTTSVAATARENNSPSITCRKCHPSVPPNRRCS